MRRTRTIPMILGTILALVLSLGTAQAVTCGGPWTGPIGATCTLTSGGSTLTFGGVAVGASAAIGISVFSPPGVYMAGCSNTGAGFTACGAATTITVPLGQTVICVVKGLNSGSFFCDA